MKKVFLSFFSLLSFGVYAQSVNCHDVDSDSCRIRIVTLSQPEPWVKIPMSYIVVEEGNYFVYYSKNYGSYCEMLTYMDVFENTPYKDIKVVVCRKKNKK